MQSDAGSNVMDGDGDQSDGDQDSLFGSPPASPIIGRSQSPALALPSASNATQNVGTIALPGSHHYSEYPVNPLALPLSNAQKEPPSRCLTSVAPSTNLDAQIPVQSVHPGPHASSPGSSFKPRKQKGKSKEPTPRPPPPEIPLPDPSGPTPVKFLRNQSALLGTAGLVGGVKPANLIVFNRGTTSSNPIVIDGEEEGPVVGRGPTSRRPSTNVVNNPNPASAPSTQEIISVLIGQKDIFPLLESLLKLIAVASTSSTSSSNTSFRRSQTANATSPPPPSGPPAKKRKLDCVPAGAVDWDVPYPFPPGQGPESYRTTWERERGRKLMSQLTKLIKSAAQKATARARLQNEQGKQQSVSSERPVSTPRAQTPPPSDPKYGAEPTVCGHYRLSTTTYGVEGGSTTHRTAQAHQVLTDTSNDPKNSPQALLPNQPDLSLATVSTTSEPRPPATLNQLMTSLVAATPTQSMCANSNSLSTNGLDLAQMNWLNSGVENTSLSPNTSATENLDQNMVNNWMEILQSFPMSAEAFSQKPPSQSGASSFPANDDFNFFEFDQNYAPAPHTNLPALNSDGITISADFNTITWPSNQPDPHSPHTTIKDMFPAAQSDIVIDPTLLAISSLPATTSTIEIPPSLTPPRLPSLSPPGDAGPATPASAAWDLSTPDVFNGTNRDSPAGDGDQPIGLHYTPGGLAQQGAINEMNAFLGTQNSNHDQLQANKVDKGKGRDTSGDIPPPLPPTLAQSPVNNPSSSNLLMPLSTTRPPVPTVASKVARKLNIAAVMKRAEERKQLLTTEMNSVKTQLWEATIEQGVLSHINKLCRQMP